MNTMCHTQEDILMVNSGGHRYTVSNSLAFANQIEAAVSGLRG